MNGRSAAAVDSAPQSGPSGAVSRCRIVIILDRLDSVYLSSRKIVTRTSVIHNTADTEVLLVNYLTSP
jgi:hypothetical protein